MEMQVAIEMKVKMETEEQGGGRREVMINKYIHNRQMIDR